MRTAEQVEAELGRLTRLPDRHSMIGPEGAVVVAYCCNALMWVLGLQEEPVSTLIGACLDYEQMFGRQLTMEEVQSNEAP
jgi:hypothetical protein